MRVGGKLRNAQPAIVPPAIAPQLPMIVAMVAW